MDSWKYYDIVHKHHTLMNPVNEDRLYELFELLKLQPGARVTDVGCGKGEILIRLAEKYMIKGVGIDLSPYSVHDAESRRLERVPNADLKILEMDGAHYKSEREESEDLAMCIGASWIYKGYKNTLKALGRMAKPFGYVMSGEPFWRKTPSQAYLKQAGYTRRLFGTHQSNVMAGEAIGLAPVYALVSSESDWDKYEGLHWFAAREYAVSHPDDPDLIDLLARESKDRRIYFNYERDILGWAVYLFQKTS
jgi:ubiquinone/menaquinone biosynthesis C-methylase UbiE